MVVLCGSDAAFMRVYLVLVVVLVQTKSKANYKLANSIFPSYEAAHQDTHINLLLHWPLCHIIESTVASQSNSWITLECEPISLHQ